MRRKIKTTPFQREILWEMADDGRVTLLALLKHLSQKFSTESPSTILERAERDIRMLEAKPGFKSCFAGILFLSAITMCCVVGNRNKQYALCAKS